jgi:imidazolonepropionase-like amidohydrolase
MLATRLTGAFSAAALLAQAALAQVDTAPTVGLRDNTPRVHALTGAIVYVAPGVVLEPGIVVLRDGLIDAVGADVEVPPDARVWDLGGRVIYPGFIDAMTELGLPASLRRPEPSTGESQPGSEAPPPVDAAAQALSTGYWNLRVRPETDVSTMLALGVEEAEALRKLGITAALVVPRRGVLRGQSALVLLGDALDTKRAVMAVRVAQHAAAEILGNGEYPSSLMGVIALMRQALYDAEWYQTMEQYYADNPTVERATPNSALVALASVVAGRQRLFYAADTELDYTRALALRDEFGLDLALVGNGYEYRQTELLAQAQVPVIVPLKFPKAPDVASPDGALAVPLEVLEHWELAPSNAAFLAQAGVAFAFTADGIEKPEEDFWTNIRTAVERGLSVEHALAALTTTPARALGVQEMLGTLESGKVANLVVADADLFTDEDSVVELVFVDGRPYELDAYRTLDAEGQWDVTWPTGSGRWEIEKQGEKLVVRVGDEEHAASVQGQQITLLPPAAVFGAGDGVARLVAYARNRALEGVAELPDGASFPWQATYAGALAAQETPAASEDPPPPLRLERYPAGGFGTAGTPQPLVVLVRGATVWTSAAQGRIEGADLLVSAGRIEAVGVGLDAPRDAVIVDATGKHVTAGLIDAHSHTAISGGVNESGSAVTLEVRIGDVLDPTDIGIYRELAGGLTTANVLHGSANPMGGQNQIIKLRWGSDVAGLKFEGAPPGVKFALGENVKQSNWGDRFTTRYPQTRMGVEEIIRDTLIAAQRYGELRATQDRDLPPVRRNLRLDAALEIFGGEREVHIHAYRQDEILAFVRLAQEFELNVAAFQHVLEGYKVADAIAEIGAGASMFSDWWAYKAEVWDAIPYNGVLMRDAGVVVSFNSDDDELATRLNTEAAKAVKYGGLSQEDALAFVTINPAIQLGVEGHVGSLEPGKDADFVIWSGPPLSAFSRAEQTWIDGRKYFDIELDRAAADAAVAERARLIQKILREQTSEKADDAEEGAQ